MNNNINNIISTISPIILSDDDLNHVFKKSWYNFVNFVSQYDILLEQIKIHHNKKLLLDYYVESKNKLILMDTIMNKYSLTNKDYDEYVKMNIDNIIKNYLKVIINGIHSL